MSVWRTRELAPDWRTEGSVPSEALSYLGFHSLDHPGV